MGTLRTPTRAGGRSGGGKRDRTADLLHAMQALSQLSYTPTKPEIIPGNLKFCKEKRGLWPKRRAGARARVPGPRASIRSLHQAFARGRTRRRAPERRAW